MDAATWNGILHSLGDAHVLQSWQWGEFKQRFGWQVMPRLWRNENGTPEAAALILKRNLTFKRSISPFCVLYIPRGPLLDWGHETLRERVLDDLQTLVRQERAILLKFDAEVVTATGVPGSAEDSSDPLGQELLACLQKRGWVFSREQVQFRNTIWLDLSAGETALLANMKQKTRYNIRLARRRGVRVRGGTLADLPLLHRMYAETSVRDGFVVRPQVYYQTVWQTFMENGMAEVLIAEVAGEAVAGLILFHFGGSAWYFYGMSSAAHREKMPNHLLQWEAIRRACALGCRRYDLWGAPDEFNQKDGMWGVFRFKEGFNGRVVRTIGAWDYPTDRLRYGLYARVLPLILDVMRGRGKARTRQQLGL